MGTMRPDPFKTEARLDGSVYGALKRLLFQMDPERAHHMANAFLRGAQRAGPLRAALQAPASDPRLRTEVLGIDFANPFGIAAGFDKEATTYNALLALGFGHVEVGTVTPVAQPGNPKPRIHRVPEHEALINSMGFPGPGWDIVQQRLHRVAPTGPVGLNIGPNKDWPRDESLAALTQMAREATADYVALNISSPNTPGLRELQDPKAIGQFVGTLREAMDEGHNQPLLLKLHPDAPDKELVAVAKAAIDAGADGIIATNTTRARPDGIPDHPGGLSGAPLHERAVQAVSALCKKIDVPVIGVGGIRTGSDALAMIQAGASLVQVYTGFIYRGPQMARRMQAELLAAMDAAGIDSLQGA